MRKSSARGYSGRAAAPGQAGQASTLLIFFTAWKYLCKTSWPSSFPLIRAPWVPRGCPPEPTRSVFSL